ARLAMLALLGAALAGCSTTKSKDDYSSLPPSGQHQAGKAYPSRPGGTIPGGLGAEELPSDQYTDLFDRIRAGYAIPDIDHYGVDREVESYRSRPDFLDRTFKRGSRYLYFIVTELERRGMPLELALLPVVESAFNPVAYSRSRAAGLWQFIPSTGKHYGLVQNWWIDERRDVQRSTMAALDYLQYLNRYFDGDWYLAIAAYNGGEGTVKTAIRRNTTAGRPTDFFSLQLRAETRDYVPKLLAIRRIVGNPAAFGLQFEPIANQPYFGVVDPGRQIDLGEAATLAGISRDDMFALNPAFNRMTTPPDGPYRLLLPVQSVEPFRVAMLTDAGAAQLAAAAVAPPQTTTHQVKRGDTISAIARRYDISAGQLLEANGLSDATIHPGDTLQVPGVGPASATFAAAAPREEIAAQLPERQKAAPQRSSGVHLVKSGDTLWGIARRYGVTVPALAAENGMDSKSPLTAGARLKIPGGSRASSTGSAEATRMTYQVRRGDTLSEIAGKFNVSVRQLTTWNGLRQSSTIRAGQRLVVYSDPKRVDGG
ncbi:MAG: LysM peptidoglycan-binding domain-containing protein, partial [Steroidobacteraceae bacterium]|nr:LysM peptidoglycan-binding domain-containing protein [Steroidobacteraceae bacterium]